MTDLRPLPHDDAREWERLIDEAKGLYTRTVDTEPSPLLLSKMKRLAQVFESYLNQHRRKEQP